MAKQAAPRARDSRFCHLCGTPLVGSYYRAEQGLVYCVTCHDTRQRCARCGTPLDDATLSRAPTATDDARLCRQCLRTTPRCAACHRHVVGTWYTFEELLPPAAVRRYCEACVRSRPRCDLCRVPVGPEVAPLDDGQYRCAQCASEMVLGDGPIRAVYDEAVTAFARVLGEGLRERPALQVVGRRQMGEVRRRYERSAGPVEPADPTGYHVLGFFVRSHGRSTIYVERGLPHKLLLGTLAHELGHAWQAERAPGKRDPLMAEGFAEWAAHHVLVASGMRTVAARATRRDDLYGRGLRHMLGIERAQGREGVLAAAMA